MEEQYRRTERLLYGIIGVLVVATLVVTGAYVFRGFRLQRAERSRQEASAALGGLDVALEGLDDETRRQIKDKLDKLAHVRGLTPEPAPRRSDDYMRDD